MREPVRRVPTSERVASRRGRRIAPSRLREGALELALAQIDFVLGVWPEVRVAAVDAAGHPHQARARFRREGEALFVGLSTAALPAVGGGRVEPFPRDALRVGAPVELLFENEGHRRARRFWVRVSGVVRVGEPAFVPQGPDTWVRIEPRSVLSWCPGPQPPECLEAPERIRGRSI